MECLQYRLDNGKAKGNIAEYLLAPFIIPTFLSHALSETIGTRAFFKILDQSPPSSFLPHPERIVLSQPP